MAVRDLNPRERLARIKNEPLTVHVRGFALVGNPQEKFTLSFTKSLLPRESTCFILPTGAGLRFWHCRQLEFSCRLAKTNGSVRSSLLATFLASSLTTIYLFSVTERTGEPFDRFCERQETLDANYMLEVVGNNSHND